MKARIPIIMVVLACICATLRADAVNLALSDDEVTPGAMQKLEVEFEAPGVYDVYLILSGPGGRFNFLRPDGTFAPRRKAVPFLVGLRVKKAGKLTLHSWRVTGLRPSPYRWSVILTKTGKSLLQKENRLGLDTRRFAVRKREAAALFSELREGHRGRQAAEGRLALGVDGTLAARGSAGRPRRAMAKKAAHEAPAEIEKAGEVAYGADKAPARDAESDGRAAPAAPTTAAPAPSPTTERKREALRMTAAKEAGALADREMPRNQNLAQARSLSAGESDDNKEFAMFLEFLQNRNRPQVMAMDVSQRRFITVLDAEGRHVPNADVEVHCQGALVYAGRTYANGQTLFFPSAMPGVTGQQTLQVKVRKGALEAQYEFSMEIKKDEKLKNQFNPASLPKPKPPVDMPYPVVPLYRGELLDKDRVAVAGAAKRAAAVREAQAPTIQNLDWLEDSGETEAEPEVEPIERAPAEQANGDWVLRLPAALSAARPHVDLVFQIDTTGSMRDEIRSVQATLDSVAARIDTMDPKPIVRWGLVLYGDKGDSYTVRRYAFTGDVKEFRQRVNNIEMTGGGDMPEAALEGLHASVSEMAWDTGPAIRLVFLVADAPPHLDYGRPYTYIDEMKEAIAKGIKIYPTAASGLDKQGEYIFRQWAQATMAKFLFITYGAGTPAGGPAGKTPHEVKQPGKRNNLDDIIVKVVGEEIQNWTKPAFYADGATAEAKVVAIPEEEELF